jgi:hypothetical protein
VNVGRFAGNGAADRPRNSVLTRGVVVGPLKPVRELLFLAERVGVNRSG